MMFLEGVSMKLSNLYFFSCFTVLFFTYTHDYTILAVGDSSIQFTFYSKIEDFKSGHITCDTTTRTVILPDNSTHTLTSYMHFLSGKTLHGTQKIDFSSLINTKYIENLDAILFSFGLVDVIWHIKPQALKQNKSFEEIIEALITPYINNILNIKRIFPHYKGHLIIMATTPPVFSQSPLTPEERLFISQTLNKALQYHALKNNIPYFDPYPLLVNDKGTLKEEYDQLDGVHFALKNNQILIDALYYFLKSL